MKVNLAIYVHELIPQVGHSRAMIEALNNIPTSKIEKLYVISYECADPHEILRSAPEKVVFLKVPSIFKKPFLLKMLTFYWFSWIYSKTKLPTNTKRISIGTAAVNVDYVNIQFVQEEWSHFYFKEIKMNCIKKLYKKLLFSFFIIFEKYLYQFNTKTKFSVLSQFELDYLREKFKVDDKRMILNYSGVNLDQFSPVKDSKQEVVNDLSQNFPQLKTLDLNKPIQMFVGAFERKGLKFVLEQLKEHQQLIIIGRPESNSLLNINRPNICHIPFTRQIHKFYTLADSFIFPTLYEPFGLVILEAAAMGLDVYTTTHKVGASELLTNGNGIHLFDNPRDVKVATDKILTYEERVQNSESRKVTFNNNSWERCGEKFQELLEI